MKPNFAITIGRFDLCYDRDYGCDHRSGWTATYGGHVVAELTGFWRALWSLFEWGRNKYYCDGCGTDFVEFPELKHSASDCSGPECTCYEIIGGHQQGCAFYGVKL